MYAYYPYTILVFTAGVLSAFSTGILFHWQVVSYLWPKLGSDLYFELTCYLYFCFLTLFSFCLFAFLLCSLLLFVSDCFYLFCYLLPNEILFFPPTFYGICIVSSESCLTLSCFISHLYLQNSEHYYRIMFFTIISSEHEALDSTFILSCFRVHQVHLASQQPWPLWSRKR